MVCSSSSDYAALFDCKQTLKDSLTLFFFFAQTRAGTGFVEYRAEPVIDIITETLSIVLTKLTVQDLLATFGACQVLFSNPASNI